MRLNAAAVAGLVFLGCSTTHIPDQEPVLPCPVEPGVPVALGVAVLIDWSQSTSPRESLPGTLQDVAHLIEALPAGAWITIRWVTDSSYDDVNRVLGGEIAAISPEPTPPINPFDRQARLAHIDSLAKHDASVSCADIARRALVESVSALTGGPGEPSARTDVHGAIMRSSELFDALPAPTRLIVLIGDGADTAGVALPDHLAGLVNARVILRGARSGADPARTRHIEESLRAQLLERGALSFDLIPSEISWQDASLDLSSILLGKAVQP